MASSTSFATASVLGRQPPKEYTTILTRPFACASRQPVASLHMEALPYSTRSIRPPPPTSQQPGRAGRRPPRAAFGSMCDFHVRRWPQFIALILLVLLPGNGTRGYGSRINTIHSARGLQSLWSCVPALPRSAFALPSCRTRTLPVQRIRQYPPRCVIQGQASTPDGARLALKGTTGKAIFSAMEPQRHLPNTAKPQ